MRVGGDPKFKAYAKVGLAGFLREKTAQNGLFLNDHS